ncbi:hypothetical protein HDU98_006202 [Podochytrium sp. JEL0797]|nr:hypothetical protein HDU98_006202 [Podochytrium sp. JEL0797]
MFTPVVLAATFATLAAAQTATTTAGSSSEVCAPMGPNDPYCGWLSPLDSAFTATGKTSSTGTLDQFMPLLGMCTGLNLTLTPFLYCYGSVGACNGATWSLPSDPFNMTQSAAFFNGIKFNDVTPAMTKAGVKPLCLDTCNTFVKPIVNCQILTSIGLKPDPCVGLPNTDCINLPGTKAGETLTWNANGGIPFDPSAPAANATSSSAAAATSTTASHTNGAMNLVAGSVAAVVAVLAL